MPKAIRDFKCIPLDYINNPRYKHDPKNKTQFADFNSGVDPSLNPKVIFNREALTIITTALFALRTRPEEFSFDLARKCADKLHYFSIPTLHSSGVYYNKNFREISAYHIACVRLVHHNLYQAICPRLCPYMPDDIQGLTIKSFTTHPKFYCSFECKLKDNHVFKGTVQISRDYTLCSFTADSYYHPKRASLSGNIPARPKSRAIIDVPFSAAKSTSAPTTHKRTLSTDSGIGKPTWNMQGFPDGLRDNWQRLASQPWQQATGLALIEKTRIAYLNELDGPEENSISHYILTQVIGDDYTIEQVNHLFDDIKTAIAQGDTEFFANS